MSIEGTSETISQTQVVPLLVTIAKYEAVVFAVFLLVGGLIGWVKKNSRMSAIVGTISAIVITVAVVKADSDNWKNSIFFLSLYSLSLLAFFFERYLQANQRFFPGGMVALTCGVSYLFFLTALIFA